MTPLPEFKKGEIFSMGRFYDTLEDAVKASKQQLDPIALDYIFGLLKHEFLTNIAINELAFSVREMDKMANEFSHIFFIKLMQKKSAKK